MKTTKKPRGKSYGKGKKAGRASSRKRFGQSEEDRRRNDAHNTTEEMWSAMSWNYGP